MLRVGYWLLTITSIILLHDVNTAIPSKEVILNEEAISNEEASNENESSGDEDSSITKEHGQCGKIEDNADKSGQEVGKALAKIIDGTNSFDWETMMQGSVNILGALTAFGVPHLAVITSMLSSILTLLKSAVAESADKKLHRMLKEVIAEDNYRQDVNEAITYKDSFHDIVKRFENYINADIKSPGELSRIKEEVMGTQPFIKQFRQKVIADYCSRSTGEVNQNEIDNQVARCLNLANFYAVITTFRQIALNSYKAILADQKLENMAADIAVVDELLCTIKEKDNKMLRFLAEYLDISKEKREVVAEFHSNFIDNRALHAYVNQLMKCFPRKRYTQVVICNKDKHCLRKGKALLPNLKETDAGNWDNKIHSLFIPAGFKVNGWHMPNYQGSMSGPYHGPTYIGEVHNAGKLSSLKIASTSLSAEDMVRACDKKNTPRGAKCMQYKVHDWYYDPLYTGRISSGYTNILGNAGKAICSGSCLHNSGYSTKKCRSSRGDLDCTRGNEMDVIIKSWIIPKGVKAAIYYISYMFKKKDGDIEGVYGDRTGPVRVNKKADQYMNVHKIRVNKGNDTPFITLCTAPDLGQDCGEIPINDNTLDKDYEINDVNHIDFTWWYNTAMTKWRYKYDSSKLRSFKIPTGYQMYVWVGLEGGKDAGAKGPYGEGIHNKEYDQTYYKKPTKVRIERAGIKKM